MRRVVLLRHRHGQLAALLRQRVLEALIDRLHQYRCDGDIACIHRQAGRVGSKVRSTAAEEGAIFGASKLACIAGVDTNRAVGLPRSVPVSGTAISAKPCTKRCE
jgi:hypothetical protein